MANLIAISGGQPSTDAVQDVRTALDARQKLADAAVTAKQEVEALDLEAARTIAADLAAGPKADPAKVAARHKEYVARRDGLIATSQGIATAQVLIEKRIAHLKATRPDLVTAVLSDQIAQLTTQITTQADGRDQLKQRLDDLVKELEKLLPSSGTAPAAAAGAKKKGGRRAKAAPAGTGRTKTTRAAATATRTRTAAKKTTKTKKATKSTRRRTP